MASYAQGKKAVGFCDRCGFEYLLKELKSETVNMVNTNLRVCPECWDPDQPQNELGRMPVSDPQALRDPRPNGADSGRVISGSLSYDFTESVEGFSSTGATLTHDSSSGTILMDYSVSGSSALLYSPTVSIDTSLYRYARLRFRFVSLVSDPKQKLTFSWIRSGESFYDTPIQTGDVNFYTNGDPWHELVWDTQDDKNTLGGTSPWSGTVTKFRFKFLNNLPDSSSLVEVDWVRLEPGYPGQGV